MSTYDYRDLIDNPRKLLPCQKNKVFLTNSYNLRNVDGNNNKPEYYDTFVLNTSPVQVSRFRFKVDILSDFNLTLYEGTRFVFGDRVYYLAQQINLVANIAVLNVPMQTRESSPPTNNSEGTLKYVIPYFGVNSINQVTEDEIVEGNVFSGGFGMEKALVGISDGYEMSGAKVVDDIGYDILLECKTTGKMVDVQIIEHFVGVDEFTAIVVSMDRIIDRGDFFQIKCLLGKLT